MSDRLRVVRRQGDVEEIRYRKADDRRYYKHATEGPTDLYLVEVDGKRGSLAMPRGDVDGWEQIDGKYWLTNKPRRSRRGVKMATKRSKRKAVKRAAARRGTTRRATSRRKKKAPPAGFASWSDYFASIRPKRRKARAAGSTSGGTMAKKKRRRRSTARRHSTNPSTRRRRSTRRYRRNPGGLSLGGRGIVGKVVNAVKDGVIGGATVVAGEAATRLVRSRVLGMPAGQTMSTVAEAGIAVAGGLVAEKMFGRQVGRDFVVGGFAGIFRATAKQLGVPLVSEALADDGGRIILPRNLAGYPRLSGYPAQRALGASEYEEEYEY